MSNIQNLYRSRYGNPHAEPALASTSVIEQMLQHRSVRAYATDKPVSDAQLDLMIAAAQSAASSSNLQAWSVVAVRDEARKARLAELAGNQKHIADAPLQLVWLADLARLEHVAKSVGRPYAALDYTEMLLVGVIDASLAAQNAAVAAQSMGLSMVYIGGMRNKPEDVAEVLGLPPRVVAVFGMCVGYEDASRPASVKPRPPQPVVLHHEIYELAAQQDGIDQYNERMARFYDEQGMKVHGSWADHSAKRVAGPETLSGRDRLVEALANRGFPLK